jgi:elongation factor G
MADKSAQRRQPGQDLSVSSPDQIRNVVLVGPAGSGKTTLIETLLVSAGALPRAGSVLDGTTVCDFEDAEHAHQRSLSVAVAPVVHQGVKINFLDTPGYADFVGELRAGLRAADCALFVIAANEQVDAATRAIWRECADVSMPRAVVITKLDQQRADYDTVLLEAQDAFGDKVLPSHVPVRDGDEVTALANLLSPGDDEDLRGQFIEGVIEESADETLMDRYLGGEEIDEKVLLSDLETAVARATFHPVIPVCSMTGVGTTELLDLVVRAFPHPAAHPMPAAFTPSGAAGPALACDPAGPLVAEVVKTTSDPYVGRISLVRVFSGTLTADSTLHVSGHFSSFFGTHAQADHDEDTRIGALSYPFGRHQEPAESVVAGDLCSIARLTVAETGDTLSSPEQPVVLKPWTMPEALLPVGDRGASRRRTRTSCRRCVVRGSWPRTRDAADGAQRGDPPGGAVVAWDEAHVEVLAGPAARPGTACQVEARSPIRSALRETFASSLRHRAGAARQAVRRARPVSPCATSRWSRCPAGPASSSSTRSSAARCPRSSSRRSRRAPAPSSTRGARAGTRWWTSGSR